MVVPLFIGMVLNTFFPDLMKIGGFTQALTGVGYPTVLGMYLFTVGTKMTVRAAPRMLMRGFGLLTAKVGIATIFALAVARFFGGEIIGLSTLAVMVAMSDTNGGMFLALTGVMGYSIAKAGIENFTRWLSVDLARRYGESWERPLTRSAAGRHLLGSTRREDVAEATRQDTCPILPVLRDRRIAVESP